MLNVPVAFGERYIHTFYCAIMLCCTVTESETCTVFFAMPPMASCYSPEQKNISFRLCPLLLLSYPAYLVQSTACPLEGANETGLTWNCMKWPPKPPKVTIIFSGRVGNASWSRCMRSTAQMHRFLLTTRNTIDSGHGIHIHQSFSAHSFHQFMWCVLATLQRHPIRFGRPLPMLGHGMWHHSIHRIRWFICVFYVIYHVFV